MYLHVMEAQHRVRLHGIPYDGKSSFLQGAAQAPARIRQELYSPAYNAYAESLTDVLSRIVDEGDLRATTYEQLLNELQQLALDEGPHLFLGGDHSVSYAIIKALNLHYGRSFHVLQFDAHCDLYDVFEGDVYSHACPFARIMEENLVLSLTQVGIRAATPHQIEQAARFGVQIFNMGEIDRFRPESMTGPLYLSLDIDVFDPAFAPGVSHPDAGGITSRILIDWLHRLQVQVIGADIVEYNPVRDTCQITAALCAKLVRELVSMMLRV